jgi:hypothetical protein
LFLDEKTLLFKTYFYSGRIFSAFFLLMYMSTETKKIKNLKISVESHEILKKYCDKKGIKIYKFIENLIIETCKEKQDIYGER